MRAFATWTDREIDREYDRLLTLATLQGFASDKQRKFFLALKREWNKRQRINYN